MAVRKLRPITPGQRFRTAPVFDEITKSSPEKSLLSSQKRSGGRNNDGKMTMRYLGGGHKKRLRIIDFKRDKHGIPAVVKAIEYDPNRSARIALLYYKDGAKSYILAPEGLKVGVEIISGEDVTPDVGNCLILAKTSSKSTLKSIQVTRIQHKSH